VSDLPLVSVAIPLFNEADNVFDLARRLQQVFVDESEKYKFEVILCENGSFDQTFEFVKQIHLSDPRFKIVRLIRNFNMEGGMLAALSHVSGDACVIMSGDLQDPPEIIPKLLRGWERGYENVYTQIQKRHGESVLRRVLAEMFYAVLFKASKGSVPRNASDFRLVSKAAYSAFNALPERVRLVRSTWAWLGFSSIAIPYERPARERGKSSFKALVTAPYALRAILAETFFPLRIIGAIGYALCTTSLVVLGGSAILWVIRGVPFAGFGTLTSAILLLFGVLFAYLGLLGEYISIIFEETRRRPSFLVAEVIGSNTDE
jgi:glycosyltransferase involved in cell wall biosynthesis